MGLLNWIFDIYQHTRIDNARDEAASVRAELASLRSSSGTLDPERLERTLGELALATKTLQRILVDKHVCDPGEFRETLRKLDREDGLEDGRAPL